MQQKRRIRYIMSFILLTAGVILFVILNICIGTVEISLSDIFASLQGKTVKNARILWDIRMPRTLAAMILGGGLALAGYLLQTFFHNPIAGPFVLGISSGAKMTVAVVMVFLTGKMIRISSGMLIFAAFLGAMISMGFVLLMSTKVHNMSMLVVSGVMIGYICSAITELIITFASDADIVNLHNWSRGSFSGITWDNVRVMAFVTGVTFLAVFLLAKPLSAYQTGEAYAKNMGVKIRLLRALLVILSSILSGCIVAFAGPICRYCSSTSDKEPAWFVKADSDDSGLFSGRQCILPVVRPVGKNHVCPYGIKYQYSNGNFWCTRGSVGNDQTE